MEQMTVPPPRLGKSPPSQFKIIEKNNKNLSDHAETLAIDSTRVLSKSTEYEDHPTTLNVSGTKKTVEILLKFRFKRFFGTLPSHFGQ